MIYQGFWYISWVVENLAGENFLFFLNSNEAVDPPVEEGQDGWQRGKLRGGTVVVATAWSRPWVSTMFLGRLLV